MRRAGAAFIQPCSEGSCPLSWLEIPVLWASFLISILFIPSLPLPVLSNSSTLAFRLSWQRKQHGACLQMEKGCHLVGEINDWHAVNLLAFFFFSPWTAVLCSLCAALGSQATTILTLTRSTRGLKISLGWRWTLQKSCRWGAGLAQGGFLHS